MAVSATITPGAVVTENDNITVSLLNQIANPTVDLSGAVDTLALGENAVADANVQSGAAIQFSKMESTLSGRIIVGNASNEATVTQLAGDATLAFNSSTSNADLTIADDAVTTAKVLDGAITGPKIAMTDDAQGDILYHNGTSYVRLGAGTDGEFLKTQGADANPVWASPTDTDTNTSVPQVDFKDSGSSGTFTVPSGVTRVKVSVQGGGGCGHTSMPSQTNFNNKGGAGGAYFEKTLTVTAGETIAWVAGAARTTGGGESFLHGNSSTITYDSTTYTAGAGQGGGNSGQSVTGGTVTGTVDISVAGENNHGGGMAGSRALSSYGNGGYNSFSFATATGQGGYVKFEY